MTRIGCFLGRYHERELATYEKMKETCVPLMGYFFG